MIDPKMLAFFFGPKLKILTQKAVLVNGQRQRVYAEMLKSKDMSFTYQDRQHASTYVQALARNLQVSKDPYADVC
jgi:hypothetical protein